MAFPMKITLIAALLLLLAACRSDPIQFHTLTPALLAGSSRSAADIQIETLTVPPQVDRPQIVVRSLIHHALHQVALRRLRHHTARQLRTN
mgnify:CR=1 FL=1